MLKQNRPQPKARISDNPTFSIMGIPVDRLEPEEALQVGRDMMTDFHRHHIVTLNSLTLLETEKNPFLKEACLKADMVLPDSSGVTFAGMSKYGVHLPRRPGIDFAEDLCGAAEELGIPLYMVGGRPGVASAAARALEKKFPRLLVSGVKNGFFSIEEEAHIIQDIGRNRARLIFIAMGMPRQEIWIRRNWNRLPPGVYMGIGGSFDVWAGNVARAPQVFQKTGLEWLYRVSREPARLGRVSRLPGFALRVITRKI